MRIKEIRTSTAMTQEELAQAIGVGRSTVAMWERNASLPSASKLPDLARILGCTIDELFDNSPAGEDSA